MSVCPGDFLKYAEEALSGDPTEFGLRNSASRAYYSSFHCCLSISALCPALSSEESKGTHEDLYERFCKLSVDSTQNVTAKSMAYIARLMKKTRHHADYDLTKDFCLKDAETQIANAKVVFSKWKVIQSQIHPAC